MNETETQVRRHPDLFKASEALAYLRLDSTSEHTLETLRRSHGLTGFMVGQEMMYHRRNLDSLVDRLSGTDLPIRHAADSTPLPAGRGKMNSGIRMAIHG